MLMIVMMVIRNIPEGCVQVLCTSWLMAANRIIRVRGCGQLKHKQTYAQLGTRFIVYIHGCMYMFTHFNQNPVSIQTVVQCK